MKTLKKQIVIIGLLIVSSWATQPLFATNYTILTQSTLESILTDIVNTYGQGQGNDFRLEVRDFLMDQLASNPLLSSHNCDYLRPKIGKAQYGESIGFHWGSGLSSESTKKLYEINSFNMRSWERDERTTTDTKITFRPITAGYYLFSFIANCDKVGSRSNPTIVIADKDIFLVEETVRKNESTENLTNWSISPNPFDQEIAIQMQANSVDRLLILLYDINGRVVKRIETMTTIDPQSFFLSTSDLANGFYTLSLQTPTKHLQQKLMKSQ